MISIEQIKKMREETGISISKCKAALEEAQGNIEKAKEILRKTGQEVAQKRSGKEATAGLVDVYLHPNHKLGVMLTLYCETDFVARSEDFRKLAHEICLQIAAMRPLYSRVADIPEAAIRKEKEIYQEQLKKSGKPEEIMDKIIKGKLEKWYQEVVLLKQPWIKDSSKNITQLIEETISKLGEKIEVGQFVRLEI